MDGDLGLMEANGASVATGSTSVDTGDNREKTPTYSVEVITVPVSDLERARARGAGTIAFVIH